MLLRLEIRDFAVISNIVFEPGFGLNCISGETGAGKSLIIDAIGLILGAKASKSLVRPGSQSCFVEACFDITEIKSGNDLSSILEELGITTDDGTLIISRQIYVSGKSLARINGVGVTLQSLKDITSLLVDIHGQHDTQQIFDEKSHVMYLDSFGGDKIINLRTRYQELLDNYKQIVTRIKSISSSPDYLERRREYLEFVIKEIGDAGFKDGDEDKLLETRHKLSQNEAAAAGLSEASAHLNGDGGLGTGAASGLEQASSVIAKIARQDPSYNELAARINAIAIDCSSLASELEQMLDKMDYDPELRDKTDKRLGLLYDLKAKYGSDINEINGFAATCSKELSEIDANKDLLSDLKAQRVTAEKELLEVAESLSEARKKEGSKLSKSIVKELSDLEMPHAIFEVEFQRHEKSRFFSLTGIDDISFRFSANPGQPPRALASIISGGEASRIMLAIKNVLSRCDNTPTLIFDEIDTGVSGKASAAIAGKLRTIAKEHQVLCVTHTAQIAAAADCNYLLSKTVTDDTTVTACELLDYKARSLEVSRLLSGDCSKTSVKLAEELIDSFAD